MSVVLQGKREIAERAASLLARCNVAVMNVTALGDYLHVECRAESTANQAARVLCMGRVFVVAKAPYRVVHSKEYREHVPHFVYRWRVIVQAA